MRYVIKFLAPSPLFLLMEREWGPQGRRERSYWVLCAKDATSFLSIEDAWAAFDRSGCGRREDYEAIPA